MGHEQMWLCVREGVRVYAVTTTNDASHFTLYNYANINLDILAITVKPSTNDISGGEDEVKSKQRFGADWTGYVFHFM